MVRKNKTVVLFISLGCFVSAHAAVHPYASLKGGVTFANTVRVETKSKASPSTKVRGELDMSAGGNIEGAFGIGISGGIPVRVEVTGGYHRNNVNAFNDVRANGQIQVGTAVANLYFDIMDFDTAYDLGPYDSPVVPYFFLGGGIAYADAELNDDSHSDEVGIFNIGAGASLNLNENLWLDAQYKYVIAQDLEFENALTQTDVQLEAHQLQVGVRVMF